MQNIDVNGTFKKQTVIKNALGDQSIQMIYLRIR